MTIKFTKADRLIDGRICDPNGVEFQTLEFQKFNFFSNVIESWQRESAAAEPAVFSWPALCILHGETAIIVCGNAFVAGFPRM
jgi:hypothetical protein